MTHIQLQDVLLDMAASVARWRPIWKEQEINDTTIYLIHCFLCHGRWIHNFFCSGTY